MSELSYTDRAGTGNSQVKVAKSTMIELNNTPVSPEFGTRFAEYVVKHFRYEQKLTINFSKRNTKKTWGSASRFKGKLNIYRWSVWVLIHELGHIVTPIELSAKGRRIAHGKSFGMNVTKIYDMWKEFNKC